MEYWEAISDAISKLRERKNRPDLDNIYGLLSRKKFKLTKPGLEEAMTELEKEKKLFRKCFKGWSLVACLISLVGVVQNKLEHSCVIRVSIRECFAHLRSSDGQSKTGEMWKTSCRFP